MGDEAPISRWRVRPALGRDQPGPDPVPQFAGGHAGERDGEHLADRGPLGDEAGDQGSDRERLPRPGAGLEDGDPRCWQRSPHVELLRLGCRGAGRRFGRVPSRAVLNVLVGEERIPEASGQASEARPFPGPAGAVLVAPCRLGQEVLDRERRPRARAGARVVPPPRS